jgi:predicted nucleic acid-binding protein
MKAVIDASVVGASLLVDEPYSDNALKVITKFLSNDLELITTSLLKYEVTSLISKALMTDRIKEKDAYDALARFEMFNFPEVDVPLGEILKLARSWGRSTYDAAYMALAQIQQAPLITADKRLFNALKGKFQWLKWVEEP